MPRLKNITPAAVSLQMFKIPAPTVNFTSQQVILVLKPGEDVDETSWAVNDPGNPSFNQDLITGYINKGILTRIP